LNAVTAGAQQVEHAPEALFAKDHLLEIATACGVDRSGAAVGRRSSATSASRRWATTTSASRRMPPRTPVEADWILTEDAIGAR